MTEKKKKATPKKVTKTKRGNPRNVGESVSKKIELSKDALKRLMGANLKQWQAVNELIANSIDGWIDLDVKTRKQLVINLDIHQPRDLEKATLTITDNACGMDLDTLTRACTSFLGSDKPDRENADLYLGMYGFGLLGSCFTLGTRMTMITTTDNKTHHLASVSREDYEKKGLVSLESYQATAQDKKLFKGSGTRVVISDFNKKVSSPEIYGYLKISWKHFLVKNKHGQAIKIKYTFNKQGYPIGTPKLGEHADRVVIDDSLVPVKFEYEWKSQKSGKSFKERVTGFVGFAERGGQSATSGGLHLYRNSQLVKAYDRDLYGWGAMTARMHGELELAPLPVTMQKNDFDKEYEGWKAMAEKAKSSVIAEVARRSGKYRTEQEGKKQELHNKFMAEWKEHFGIQLTAAERNLLASGGSIDGGGGGGDVIVDTDTPSEPEEENGEVKYKIKDLFNFNFDNKKYSVQFTYVPEEEKGPWFVLPQDDGSGGTIQICISTKIEGYEVIQEAEKKLHQKIPNQLIKAISLDCIKQVLKADLYEVAVISQFSKDYWENA